MKIFKVAAVAFTASILTTTLVSASDAYRCPTGYGEKEGMNCVWNSPIGEYGQKFTCTYIDPTDSNNTWTLVKAMYGSKDNQINTAHSRVIDYLTFKAPFTAKMDQKNHEWGCYIDAKFPQGDKDGTDTLQFMNDKVNDTCKVGPTFTCPLTKNGFCC